MIKIIPNILTSDEIYKLFVDVDPKNTSTSMSYFKDDSNSIGIKKVRCTDHPIISRVIDKIEYKNLESVSIVYYPTGSYNGLHIDNSIVENGITKKIKDWTHTGIIFMNNNFTGGELIYPEHGCVFLPTVGTMVITPAGPEYPHFVSEIKTGERFTLVFRFL
jgi:hypothetical protein